MATTTTVHPNHKSRTLFMLGREIHEVTCTCGATLDLRRQDDIDEYVEYHADDHDGAWVGVDLDRDVFDGEDHDDDY